MRILFVEDDPVAREYIHKGLREHGHVIDLAEDGLGGLEKAKTGAHDLIVLDVMLPEIDGFEVLRELRASGSSTPVIFLSARGEVGDRVKGLRLGGDDYLAKPFAFAELLARVQAVGRRHSPEPEDGILRVADLSLDLNRHTVSRARHPIQLTQKQFALLDCLMRAQGRVVSRTMLIEEVWGYSFESYSNVIDVHIANLRKKIDHGFEPKLLHTVKGIGYVLDPEREE